MWESVEVTADATTPAPTNPPVCILGLGLIGGSLLRVLHDAPSTPPAYGYNRSSGTVSEASATGYDASDDLVATLRRAAVDDALIVLATPATTLQPIVDSVAEHAPDCLITDVVSVKEPVTRLVAQRHPQGRFVGGHPMAGTSRSGWSATDPTLFDGAMWMVSTPDDVVAADWLRVASMALATGAHVVPAADDAHDRAVAAISHLPHLMAAATAAVGAGESDLALRLAAGSFRDGTRVAGTAPALQQAMLEANDVALLNALSQALDRLLAVRDDLRDRTSVEILVNEGHRARQAYEEIAGAAPESISGVQIGAEGWQEELRRLAHRGQVWDGQTV